MNNALFVIDVQGFFENKKTKSIAKKINKYIQGNKDKYSFVIFTVFKNVPGSSLEKFLGFKGCVGGKDTKILSELSEAKNQNIVFRNTYSLLKVSEVFEKLKQNKIEQVDVCGLDTDCCVMATIYDLFDSGYKPVVLPDLCFSTSKEKLHKPALKIIKRNCV
jgi:nicotinamidase-related amidase